MLARHARDQIAERLLRARRHQHLVDLKGTSAELLRIDADDDLSIRIFFRIFRGNQQLP